MLAKCRSFWRTLLRRARFERELEDELRFHVESRADDLMRGGLSRAEALLRARIELGPREAHKDAVRESRGLRFFDELGADLRFAMRSLRRHLGLALAVTATLTIGIAVSSVAFTLFNAQYLKARFINDPGSFAQVFVAQKKGASSRLDFGGIEREDLEAIQQRSKALAQVAGASVVSASLGEDLDQVWGSLVTCNHFSVGGVLRPVLGRLLDQRDCSAGARVMVMSEALWRGRFGADPNVVGRVLSYNLPLTVVGIAGGQAGKWGNVYVPYTLASAWERPPIFAASGRLSPGHTRAQAGSELNLILAQQDRLHPGRRSTVVVTDGSWAQRPFETGKTKAFLGVMLGVLIMVVMLVSANVVTLLLSRAHARRHEIAVRLALGAGRRRLMKMLMTETLLLAAVAGALSLVIAHQLPLMLRLVDGDVSLAVGLDWRVWAFVTAASLMAGLLTGLTPALEALKADQMGSLKGKPGGDGVGGRRIELRGLLIGAQVAVAVALLAGAALFVRAYQAAVRTDPGFEPRRTMLVPLRARRQAVPPSWAGLRQAITGELRATAGIEGVAFAEAKPHRGGLSVRLTSSQGRVGRVKTNGVSGSLFRTLGVPIRRGRGLAEDDPVTGSTIRVVVSQSLVDALLPGREPLGETLSAPDGVRYQIVGVIGDLAQPGRAPWMLLFRPLPPGPADLLVRFSGDEITAAGRVVAALKAAAPGGYGRPVTYQTSFDHDVEEIGNEAAVVLILGSSALALALIGVYGTVSFTARRRMKEMGIRVALGARGGDILRALMNAPALYVVAGLTLGLSFAFLAAPSIEPLEKDLAFRDPLAYFTAAAVVAAAALAAMLRPARRAMAADPVTVLRED